MHSFKKGTEVKFLGKSTDTGLYKFENEETGVWCYVKEENFEWVD